jgi:hypothetical protein
MPGSEEFQPIDFTPEDEVVSTPEGPKKGDTITEYVDGEALGDWEYLSKRPNGNVIVAQLDPSTGATKFRAVPPLRFREWQYKPPTDEDVSSEPNTDTQGREAGDSAEHVDEERSVPEGLGELLMGATVDPIQPVQEGQGGSVDDDADADDAPDDDADAAPDDDADADDAPDDDADADDAPDDDADADDAPDDDADADADDADGDTETRPPDIPEDVWESATKQGLTLEFLRMAERNAHASRILRDKYKVQWGKQLPASAVRDSLDHYASPEQIKAIEESRGIKITMEYIEFAKRNPHAADYLRAIGLDIQLPGAAHKDPVMDLVEEGRKRDDEIAGIAKEIEGLSNLPFGEFSGSVRARLRRPGVLRINLPLIKKVPLEKTPFLGPAIAKRVLAMKISKNEITLRKEAIAELEGLQKLGVRDQHQQARLGELTSMIESLKASEHTDGNLNLGLPRYPGYVEYLKRRDEMVKSQRRKLGLLARRKLRGPGRVSARRDLAELIYKSEKAQEALDKLEIDPEDLYVHQPFKAKNKAYQATLK